MLIGITTKDISWDEFEMFSLSNGNMNFQAEFYGEKH